MNRGTAEVTNCRQSGFTLVEVLVSIAIMMLIAPLAIEGVRTGLETWNRLEARADVMDRARTAQRVIRKQISEALPVKVDAAAAEGAVFFHGSRADVEFVANLPGHVSGGGLFHNRIQSAVVGNEKVLLLSFWPFNRVDGDESDIQRIVLGKGVESIEIGYFGAMSLRTRADWHDHWDNQVYLPQRVRFRVLREDNRYPIWSELIIPVYASSQQR